MVSQIPLKFMHKSALPSRFTGYLSVPLDFLASEDALGFAVFSGDRGQAAPSMIAAADKPIDAALLDGVRARGIATALIPAASQEAYQRHIERRIESHLKDEALPVTMRRTLLYGAARTFMRDALEGLSGAALAARAEAITGPAVDFLYTHAEGFTDYLPLMSFDYHIATHSVNVFIFWVHLARRIGRAAHEVKRAAIGALLLDIGKRRIEPAIVNSRGKLSAAEWEAMKLHPIYSHGILREAGVEDALALSLVRHHHEKLDGSGYPDGLRDRRIPPLVRALTICDVFDALTTNRAYKGALRSFESIKVMQSEMRDELDADLLREFIALIGGRTAGAAPQAAGP